MFNWSKQVILLTGGTGSFGQAFTKYILKKHPPKILRIYSRDEYKQFQMQQEIDHPAIRFFIGDVRDKERLIRAMQDVTLVIHAAAMKQIVACEYNPTEAIYTNIIGAQNVITAAIDSGVQKFFGLITDKAVSPINLYGATKLCMEKLLIQANSYRGNRQISISCVRYGNVAGSRGSVIPLFQSQLKKGVLTITHPEMTRFWITLKEGVEFVVSAIEKMNGGEIFIPKMPSFKITDLVAAMVPKTIKTKITGIRAGEKLHEDLITIHESVNTFEFPNFFLIKPDFAFWEEKQVSWWKKGKPVSQDFSYNSRMNPRFLKVTELQLYLKRLGFI